MPILNRWPQTGWCLPPHIDLNTSVPQFHLTPRSPKPSASQAVFGKQLPKDHLYYPLQEDLKSRARVIQGDAGDLFLFNPQIIHSYWIGKAPDGADPSAFFRLLPHFHSVSLGANAHVRGNLGIKQWLNSLQTGSVNLMSLKVHALSLHKLLNSTCPGCEELQQGGGPVPTALSCHGVLAGKQKRCT